MKRFSIYPDKNGASGKLNGIPVDTGFGLIP